MSIDMFDTARGMLALATQRTTEEIPDNASISNWEGWNSLSHMRLILAMEEFLHRELAPEDLVEIETLGQVAFYLGEQSDKNT